MKKYPFYFGLIVLAVYFLPFIISGENHYITIHDFLDSSTAHLRMLKDNGSFFDYSSVLPVMDGIPRLTFGSPLNLRMILYMLLPTYWAIVLNLALIKFTAFFGMFILLKDFVLAEGRRSVILASSLLFALVPFYPDYGLSSAGIPLLAWAALNLFRNRKFLAGACVIAYFSFFSSLVLSGLFAGIIWGGAIVWRWIRTKKFPLASSLGLFLMAALFTVFNFDLFAAYFSPSGETYHRIEFETQNSILTALGDGILSVLVSQYHAGTFFALLILGIFFTSCRKDNGKTATTLRRLTAILAALMVFTPTLRVIFKEIPLMREMQFERFYFLYPALCFCLLAVALDKTLSNGKRKKAITLCCILALFNIGFDNSVITEAGRVSGLYRNAPGFAQYYDTELFDVIKQECGIAPEDKVVCFGLAPAVAEYNGFHTADCYIHQYPLSYKHRFRKVIQEELDKSPELMEYFCKWGSRCYIFSSELGRNWDFGKDSGASVGKLEINISALMDMGVKYLFSVVEISNREELGLIPAGEFSTENSWWNIRVFRISSSEASPLSPDSALPQHLPY